MATIRGLENNEVLGIIKRYADLTGEAPSIGRVERDRQHLDWLVCAQSVAHRFGGWKAVLAALEDASLIPPDKGPRPPRRERREPRVRGPHKTQEQKERYLVGEVQRFFGVFGRLPRRTDWRPRKSAKVRSAIRLQEIEKAQQHGPWPPTTAPERTFGSWSKMLEAAGFVSDPSDFNARRRDHR